MKRKNLSGKVCFLGLLYLPLVKFSYSWPLNGKKKQWIAHISGLYSTVGVHVQPGGMAHWLLDKQLRSAHDKQAQSQRAASELETERRNILNAMRYREPERGVLGP